MEVAAAEGGAEEEFAATLEVRKDWCKISKGKTFQHVQQPV